MRDDQVFADGLYDDGNIFAIMGKASKALKRAGRAEDATQMIERVTSSTDYGLAVAVIMEYATDEEPDAPADDEDDDDQDPTDNRDSRGYDDD
jgi:hypothetical protein